MFAVSFTIDVIGSCAFGLDCNSFKDPYSPFKQYGMRVFNRNLKERITDMFALSFPKIAMALHVTLTPKEVRDFFYDVVTKAVNYRKENNFSRKDFLQLLIDINEKAQPGKKK